MSDTLDRIREATRGTEYEGRLYVVGGVLRDRALGLPASDDVDLVLEGDALELAWFLFRQGLSDHAPVEYPRFGTAKIALNDSDIEVVSARAEKYDPAHRKPEVRRATLADDALRRDFTINTLMQNLHTGEELDLTGRARADLAAGLIRTPLEPRVTFYDDPLRMLRAVRFAARFGFEIEAGTWRAIREEAGRLNLMGPEPPVVSAERIRDEFVKMLMAGYTPPSQGGERESRGTGEKEIGNNASLHPSSFILHPSPLGGEGVARALALLRESNLMAQFLPELLAMVGVTQNDWHIHDVWDHTLLAMRHLPPDTPLELRLGLLFHDVGKPATRSEDEKGVHFYEHQFVGAEIAERALHRLKFPNDQIRDVAALVRLHMRLGEYRPDWADPPVKRLMRDTAAYSDLLFALGRCDMAAMNPDAPKTDLDALRARMDELNRLSNVAQIKSPLDGREIMETLGIPPGPPVREAKEFLTNEVIEGRLTEGDKETARALLRAWFDEGRKTKDEGVGSRV
jgi:poly(A) polymerase